MIGKRRTQKMSHDDMDKMIRLICLLLARTQSRTLVWSFARDEGGDRVLQAKIEAGGIVYTVRLLEGSLSIWSPARLDWIRLPHRECVTDLWDSALEQWFGTESIIDSILTLEE